MSIPLISIPKLNPLRIYNEAIETPFALSIPKHFQQVKYAQIFQRFDEFAFQIQCELVDPDYPAIITTTIYDINDRQVLQYVSSGISAPPYYYFNNGGVMNSKQVIEFRQLLTVLQAGFYQIKINVFIEDPDNIVTQNVDFWTEPIEVRTKFDKSLRLDYTHEDNSNEMIFIDPYDNSIHKYYHRIVALFSPSDYQPSTKDYVYRDQIYDLTQLKSIPFITCKLTFGNAGIPNYQADIINRIFSCNSVFISGKQYVKNEGAKMEKINEKLYPLNGWKLELVIPSIALSNIYNSGDFNNDFNNDFNIE